MLIQILLSLILLTTIYPNNLFNLAYQSIKVDCLGEQSIENTNVVILGSYNNTSKEIYNYVNQTANPELFMDISKHELCHKKQLDEGRMGNCQTIKGLIKLYFNEWSCYTE